MSDPVPSLPPAVAPATWRERVTEVASRVGIDEGRLLRLALGACAVAVLAVVAFIGWRSTGRPAELDLPRATPVTGVAATDTAEPNEPATAHAAGAVTRPGVYKLPPGARVTDLLDAAGGPTADADVDQLNLAAPVGDGERVYVPHRGEAAPVVAAGATGAPAGPVDLNRATPEQLEALPGVGPATAKAIVDYRTQHGRFRSIEQLLEVRGIGDAKFADLRDQVKV